MAQLKERVLGNLLQGYPLLAEAKITAEMVLRFWRRLTGLSRGVSANRKAGIPGVYPTNHGLFHSRRWAD